ncbi:rhodanese-like domain-containing protein [Streptomyces sp. NK15101]|uniref:rhodanese-like domain-containing protein n=1 Tax=Streptomyces sp. NK15101 TaxID=2873261 RepID=UPI001CED931F|nr:rhodanese-like domain-containing protein [Streptomyces sp. NK15101]
MADTAAAPTAPRRPSPASRVLAVPAAEPGQALDYFLRARLACETDPFDVHHDVSDGVPGFVLIDARQEAAYREETLPGARSVPHPTMTADVLAGLDPAPLYVTFGWGPACNAGTKAAAALAGAGFRVKEMIGGLEYWKRQNYPTQTRGPVT